MLNPSFRKVIDIYRKRAAEHKKKSTVKMSDSNNILTFREKAIVSLALYTGIRGCDIANLKLTDIDWKKERVSFVQEKTGNPIVLPLLPHVGNSLFDYIRNERTKVSAPLSIQSLRN